MILVLTTFFYRPEQACYNKDFILPVRPVWQFAFIFLAKYGLWPESYSYFQVKVGGEAYQLTSAITSSIHLTYFHLWHSGQIILFFVSRAEPCLNIALSGPGLGSDLTFFWRTKQSLTYFYHNELELTSFILVLMAVISWPGLVSARSKIIVLVWSGACKNQ